MRHASLATVLILPLVLLGIAGCDSGTEPVGTEPVVTQPANEDQQVVVPDQQPESRPSDLYPLRGEVVTVDREKPSVTIQHEAIEGVLEVGTLEFEVQNAEILEGLEEGDQVQGQLLKKDGDFVISEIKKNEENTQ